MSATIKDLLQTLADGARGFSAAAKSVKYPDLRDLFESYSAERKEMADELSRCSGVPHDERDATVTGVIHRGWITLRSTITAGDDHAILAECERGEHHAADVFRRAAEENSIPEAAPAIASIFTRLLVTHNQVRALRNASRASMQIQLRLGRNGILSLEGHQG